MKKQFTLFFLQFLIILGFAGNIHGQLGQNRYCIYVKQEFSSWCDCSGGGSPSFGSAKITLNSNKNDALISDVLMRSSDVNDTLRLNLNFHYDGADKTISNLVDNSSNKIGSIKVRTWANHIVNDHELEYSFDVKELRIGVNSKSSEASDPCHNVVSSNREGYTMKTTVFIDDPIIIENVSEKGDEGYSLDYDKLSLRISDYYNNKQKEKPYLQVALDNGMTDNLGTEGWTTIPDISLYPKATIDLTYSMIAGKKDVDGSNFYSWMGRSLKFRVVKTLMDSTKTIGNIIPTIRFYPKGLQYSILQTRRTFCNNDVVITAKLDNSVDEGYITKIDATKFYWAVAAFVNGEIKDSYRCTMESTNDPFTYKLKIRNKQDKDPFNESSTVPIEWRMQLVNTDPNDLNAFACVKSFTIPPKPPAVSAAQKPDKPYTVNGTEYHVPDMNHPFAMLNVIDTFAFASLRQPYTIWDGDNELLRLESLPDTYENMTPAEKAALDAQFETEFSAMINKPNNPYRTYLEMQVSKWMNDNKNGTPLPIPSTYDGAEPRIFSNDGKFFLFTQWYGAGGPLDIVYKATINNDNTYTIEQKTEVGGSGVVLSDISPDNNILVYTQWSNNGHSVWQLPLNIPGSKNATEINSPFPDMVTGEFQNHDAGNLFFDNNNIIVQVSNSFPYSWYKVNLSTGTLTNLYNGTGRYPILSPDGSFVLFSSWNTSSQEVDLYKGTIFGNTLTDVAKIATNCGFVEMSPDGTYALIGRDYKIYKLMLTGSQAGDEVPAIPKGGSSHLITPDNKCVYYSSDNDPTIRGIYLSELKGDVGTRLSSVGVSSYKLLLSPDGRYIVYTNNSDKKMYKLYLSAALATDDLYPYKGIALDWYNAFRANYKQLWLYQQVGVKVTKGIRVNEDQYLVLKDGDQCSYPPFLIHVSAPPHPDFSHTIVSKPSDACAHDGSVRITYNGGGSTPFKHAAGTLSSVGNSIVVTGLSYGDNMVQFFDNDWNTSVTYNASIGSATIGITSTPATDQTCPTANGSVTINVGNVSGNKDYKLICDFPHKEYTASTTSDSYKFSGLPAGTYKAEVTSGSCYFTEENIEVESKIFDITVPIATADASTLDGTGSVTLNFENRVNSVDISSFPNEFNGIVNVDNKTYTVAPKAYNVVVRHTDTNGACNVSKTFTVNKPQFSAAVNLEENDAKLTVRTSLSNTNLLLSPFKIRLLRTDRTVVSESTSNGLLSTDIQTTGNYIVNLQYGSTNEADLCSFSYPLGTINNINTVNPPSCPGGNASVALSPTGGIDGSNFLFSLSGTQFSAPNTFSPTAGIFSYFIKDDNISYGDVHWNVVTINKSLVKHFELPITEPSKVAAERVIPVNVTCAGSNNGSVSVANLSGGSGTYQYKVDDGVWKDPSLITTGLVPGMHSVYLRDSQNSCPAENIGNINIKDPDSLKIDTMIVVQPKCELPNGSIKVEVKGGNKPYKYDWTFNGSAYFTSDTTSDTITNIGAALPYGLYHLKVVDINNCELHQSVNLNRYYNPSIGNVSVTDVNCYGESNGSATILQSSGTNAIAKNYIKGLDFVYVDTIRDLSQSFDTLRKGRYEIYAIDTYGCLSNSPYNVIVHQPDTIVYLLVDTITPVIAKGSATGSIKSIVYGGNTGLKEIKLLNSAGVCVDSSLQRNEFPFFFPDLKAGNYTIRAIDNKGCNFITKPLTVKEPENALGFKVIDKHNALCKAQTGFITVQGFGGWGGYTYKRTSYNAFYKRNSFEDLYAGNYLITVRDSLGATYSDTVVIYEPQDSLRSRISGLAVPACTDNGALQVQVFGGTAPYSILNQTTGNSLTALQPQSVNFANLSAGSYLFNVTDSNGCHFDLEIQLPDTNLLEIVRLDPVFPSGISTPDGAIQAMLHGGKLPYTYQWKQRFGGLLSETSSTLKNIPSGHYQLNVFESGGCSDTAYLYLPGINDMAFSIGEVGNETSYLAHDGYCTLSSVFNSWQNFELITPSNSHLYFNSTDSTALFYCKSNKVFLRNLSGGDYFISGIASTGEKVYAEFKIEPYLRFHISNVDIVNVDTTGGSNGKITLVVSGGGGNNRFTWEKLTSSGNTLLVGEDYTESSILNNVPAGNYRITVTDKYNNSIYDTIQVQEPASPLTISIAEYKNESCKTYEDAYVILKATGGWGDYQFRDDVTPYFKNGNIFYNLDVRKHDFYLTDKKGTVRSISFNITEPDYLTSKVAFIDSVNCKNRADGNISFTINGGTAPYRFANLNTPLLWTQDSIVHNIPAGYHTYLFTDSNNCIGQDTLTVLMPEPDSLLFNKIDVTHTTCSTDNGIIKIKMQGGTKPYRYEWANANNEPIGLDTVVTGLSQNGLYTVNVFDWHNCPQHLEQRIKPSVNPVITDIDTIPVLCYGGNTGTAFITQVLPGTPYAPYSFTWSNGDTGKIAHGYNEGVHFVTIADTNHCSTVKYFGITQPDSLWVTIVDSKNAHCYGYNDAFLKAEGRGGVGGYKYHWSTGDTTNITNNLYKGSYSLSITDANGCKNDNLFTITEPDKLLVQIGDDVKMCPGNSYTLDGKAFTTHKWSTSNGVVSNERYITVKEENDYFLEVTDSIGCFAWDTIKVSIGNDALKSDFLLTSQAALGDTLSIFELSNMALDSLRWNYSDTIFSQVENTTGLNYILLLKTMQNGVYNVDLYAYSGGCVSKSTKQVEIIGEQVDPGEDDNLGYQEPLIISLVVAPNPNDGNFTINVKLRKVADINLTMFAVTAGLKIDERSERGLEEYSVDYSLSQLNSGIYLLILKAENERKQIKIIIQH